MDAITEELKRTISELTSEEKKKYKELRKSLNRAITTKEAEAIYSQIMDLLKK
ncbi:hypothetical protein [Oceanobacillus salinisoli]|uniref:hypothetical protein n=1 Tax=Oceanobacillus salinisoli TaxID=2678611 RepID=UPI0012E19553|nr:hypothetical protein [Oceanobacillus salinisoli]